jgi:hypothetical protein
VVTREPEFDDAERERLMAYLAYQAGICECGIHESLSSDKSNFFTFEKRTCLACRGKAQYLRILADEDKAVEDRLENAPPAAARPSDGRRLFLRQLSPLEVAARRSQHGQGG